MSTRNPKSNNKTKKKTPKAKKAKKVISNDIIIAYSLAVGKDENSLTLTRGARVRLPDGTSDVSYTSEKIVISDIKSIFRNNNYHRLVHCISNNANRKGFVTDKTAPVDSHSLESMIADLLGHLYFRNIDVVTHDSAITKRFGVARSTIVKPTKVNG